MVHIVLLIFKIAGLLLLGLLALILVLLLILLLAPLKCTLKAEIDNCLESSEGKIRFHWIFHLISGEAAWHGGEFTWLFRIAWKKFSSEDEESGSGSGSEYPADRSLKSHTPEPDSSDAALTDSLSGDAGGSETKAAPEKESGYLPESPGVQKRGDKQKNGPGSRFRIQSLISGIKSRFERIKCTFQRLCDNMKSLNNKRERISRFISNEIHQRAFTRLIREIKGLLRRLSPNRASVNITFGFKDPSYTGYTLAGISLIYPVIGRYTSVTPDFENKVLKGDIFISEKIRLIYVVIFAWNMLIDKNVRMTYRHLRKIKL